MKILSIIMAHKLITGITAGVVSLGIGGAIITSNMSRPVEEKAVSKVAEVSRESIEQPKSIEDMPIEVSKESTVIEQEVSTVEATEEVKDSQLRVEWITGKLGDSNIERCKAISINNITGYTEKQWEELIKSKQELALGIYIDYAEKNYFCATHP